MVFRFGLSLYYWIFVENTHTTVFPSTSSDDRTDYYNFDGSKSQPATAIPVDDLPDVVLQPEFRQELDAQFEVNKFKMLIFETILVNSTMLKFLLSLYLPVSK